jgi:hypothetical protein
MANQRVHYEITADDRTRQATASALRNMEQLKRTSESIGKALKFGIAGFGGLSLIGVAREASEMARSFSEAVRATNNLGDARARLGKFTIGMSDDEVRRVARLGDEVNGLADALKRLEAVALSKAASPLTRFVNDVTIALGGGTRPEQLRNQIEWLKSKRGQGGVLNAGILGNRDIASGYLSPARVEAEIARLEGMLRNAPSGRSMAESRGYRPTDTTPIVESTGGGGRGSKAEGGPAYTSMYSLGFGAGVNQAPQSLTDYGQKMAEELQSGFGEIDLSEEIRAGVTAPLMRATEEMSVYGEQAARNMQDAFAQFLFDPFDGGVKGMLKGFGNALRQMAAQAAAAKFFESSGVAGFLGSLFGGFRASGGPVSSGRSYVVGERGPELFVPGASGAIVPNGAMSGAAQVTYAPVYNVGANTVSREELAMLMARDRREFARVLADSQSRQGLPRLRV